MKTNKYMSKVKRHYDMQGKRRLADLHFME